MSFSSKKDRFIICVSCSYECQLGKRVGKMKTCLLLLSFFLFRTVCGRLNYNLLLSENSETACHFDDYDDYSTLPYPKISAPHKKSCGGRNLRLVNECMKQGLNKAQDQRDQFYLLWSLLL